MPPATATPSVSLRELADLAIGTPEVGAVNFTALHTLLVAMLKSLNLQDTRIDFQSPMLDQSRSFESARVSTSTPQLLGPKERRRSSVARAQTLETQVKDLGGQVQDLGRQLKTMGSQVQAIVAHVQHFPTQTGGLEDRDWLETKDLALLTQEKGQTGPTKGRRDSKPVFQGPELLQDLMEDMKILKEAHQKKEQPELQPEKLLQRIEELERIIRERGEFLELLNRKLSGMPSAEEATMVTWEELEQAITDGWKGSQTISESSTGLQRRKRQGSITSNDLIASGVSTAHPSVDQAIDSAGFITDKTFSGTSSIGYPFDGPPGRERSRVSSATGFPGREQHSRARDEAGLARPHPPSMSQLRAESDRRRSREQHSLGHLRRDERDAHLGPVFQDVSLPRDRHPQVSPDQHRGVFTSPGHLYARPDQYGLGSFDSDQLELLYPSTSGPGMVPFSVDQVGVMLPGMDEQELVLAGLAQGAVVPPLAPGRDQQASEQPSTDQPGMVPLSTYQLPGMDESGMGPLGTYQSGLVPLGVDRHGFVIYPMDQQVFVQPSLGTSGFIQPGIEQHEMIQPGAGQAGVVQPGAGQPGAGQPGVAQPSAGQAGVPQPGAGQAGVVQPGAGQPGVVQPGAGQAGVVQPGAGQPGVVQPGAGQPGVVQPGAGQAGVVQPGAGQPGVAQPGAGQPGVAQPGAGQAGVAQPGAGQPGVAQPGAGQAGVAQPGAGQPGVVQPGAGQPGVAQPGAGQPGVMQPRMYLRGLVQPGMYPRGLVQPEMYPRGLVQPGIGHPGFMQPRMYPRGLVQPGMYQRGLVPPRLYQRGLVQPGAGQPGMVQPDIGQPDLVQPGAGQAGVIQAGAGQAGVIEPGAGQAGVIQPSAGQAGVIEPGAGQAGVIQPGAGQAGVIEPGAGQAGVIQPGAGQAGVIQPGAGQVGVIQAGAGQAGVIKPGAGQAGVIQPGAGQVGVIQPGAGQAGVIQPGAGQAGVIQPGAGQAGVIQPGAGQAGVIQPGAGQAGVIEPGAGQAGVIQPGAGQAGVIQPGAGQVGVIQPGAGQAGVIQPGAGQAGVIQPGAGQAGVIQPGAGQAGVIEPGAGQAGVIQPGAGQAGVIQPGAGQAGVIQPGAGQVGVIQPGAGQVGVIQPGAGQVGVIQPGAGQVGVIQAGAGQAGVIKPGAGQAGVIQPGAGQVGVIQPGAGQVGVIQPGAGQVGVIQPGAGQAGVVQPGAGQPGLVQPQVDQYGLVQPDRGRHGFFPPNISMPGLVPPGAYPPGLVQTGAYPRGFVQPGANQQGLVQPVIDPHWGRQPGTGRSIIPPGTELLGFPTHRADSRSLTSPRPYQQGVAPPGRDQYGRVSSLLASQGLTPSGIDREVLLREMYRQGLLQRGPAPLSTAVGSAPQDQQHLETPEPEQHDQAVPDSIADSQGLMYGGPGYQGVDQQVQVGVGPKELYNLRQPRVSVQTSPSQEALFPRSTHSLDYLNQGSSERSDTQSERHESLDKLTPSFPIAVETFRMMGEIIALYTELKENIKDLDEEQAGQTDLEKIQYLLALMVKKSIPPDLQEQLKTLKALTKEIRQEKAKMEKMSKILEGHGEKEIGKEEKGSPLNLQLGILRVTMADIEKELGELRERQEKGKVSMEQSVSEASIYLQDQLDKLRTIIENMLASSSTLLSMSLNMTPHKTLTTLAPSQIDPAATCPACSLDLSHQVSMLVQRYEQLQNMVNNLAASRPSRKAKLQSQDEELLGHVQSAILQVQGDCEKLNITTSNLIEDHRQKQKDIDVLYQGLEKLEREKANREHLEMEIDVKADKSALAAKVSRVQFDATTEQLNHMMQELVAKMTGQEQDWQKMLDKLLVEMDNKLDRLELDPVKQSLEDRWKSLRQQLKERSPLYQADEAAAMRRQLLAHFHCLSCDRPLETPVTGQVIPVTPVGPCLPGHRSVRPYTVFELEQVRQQSRNLKLGSSGFPRGDLGPVERSVGRLRTMHSKMLLDIEKVQIHFGGSVKASSQMIHELLQAQCLSSPCYRRLPDMADYSYPSAPRPCGGSHTLTYPYRRIRLQHLSQGMYPTEEIQIAMKHDEVDILGLDGHIYKGRMETRLPDLLNKDNAGMKNKTKQPRPHGHRQQSLSDGGQLPSRPQSAQTLAANDSAPSRHRKDRPVSTEGRLSQPNPAHLPSETANLPGGLDVHRDMPPGEGLEEPTRGPRSTSAH